MIQRKVLTAVLVVLVVSSGTAAATGIMMDPTAEQYPKTYYQEDQLTVTTHDMGSMDRLDWENDNGEIVQLDAHVNGTSEGETVSYLATELEDDQFSEYPRKDDEENNSASALDASEYTTGGANSAKISVSDATGDTAPGVEAVQIATDGSMTSGDVAYASYSNQSITTDVQKRHAQLLLDVNTLDAPVEIQFRDSGGDYAVAELNSSRAATADDVVTNTTGQGIIYQGQIGELPVVTGDDGTVDSLEEIRIVAEDGDADLTITAVNVEKKSQWDFGTTAYTDSDGNVQEETVYQNADGDRVQLTSLDTLGSWSEDTVIHNLRYIDLEYRMQDDSDAVTVEFKDAEDYPGFPTLLEVSFRQELPTGYDLSHGDIDLVMEQSFLTERYTKFRYAEAVGDTDTEDLDSWTDLSGSLGERDSEITVDSTVQPGATNVVQFEAKLTEDQTDALELSSAGGFWGDSGGGGNPFTNIYNWAVGGIVGAIGFVATKLRGIGG